MGPGVKSTAVLTTERETAGHHVPPDGSVRSYQGRHLAKKRKEKKSEPGQAPRSDFHLQDKDRMGVRGAAPWGGVQSGKSMLGEAPRSQRCQQCHVPSKEAGDGQVA